MILSFRCKSNAMLIGLSLVSSLPPVQLQLTPYFIHRETVFALQSRNNIGDPFTLCVCITVQVKRNPAHSARFHHASAGRQTSTIATTSADSSVRREQNLQMQIISTCVSCVMCVFAAVCLVFSNPVTHGANRERFTTGCPQ